MIDPTVRAATGSDVQQLVSLEHEAREHREHRRGGQRWLADHPVRGGAWPWIVDEASVQVAHIDAVVVGYLVLVVEGDRARVDEVYVTPAARELGFGDELLGSALARARALGAISLDAEALPGDRATKNLYERAGIKARLITVSTPL